MKKFIGLIPVDMAIGPLWPGIRALLEKAEPYGRGEYTVDDIRDGIEKREMIAIGAVDECAQVEFVMTCSVVSYPRKKVLYIQSGAGKGSGRVRSVLEEVAKHLGCDWIESRCRYTVSRVFRRSGFTVDYCVPILEI